MNTKIFGSAAITGRRLRGCGAALALTLSLTMAACSSSKSTPTPPPALLSVAVTPGTTYLATGATQQYTATGHYADGAATALTAGLTWTTSDAAVATVGSNGLVTAVGPGAVTVTASHTSTGISGTADLTARVVVAVPSASLPQAAAVGTGQTYVKISGLTAGAFYQVSLTGLTDDADLEVYSDLSRAAAAQKCVSQAVGQAPESCVAPANAAGELVLVADGQWTEEGAEFTLDAVAAEEVAVAATLTLADLPHAGSVGTEEIFYRVTGLTPGAAYVVRLGDLTDDADLEVYGDRYEFVNLCSSYSSGTSDDFCTAAANAAGELLVEVNGENTASGSGFTLTVTAAP